MPNEYDKFDKTMTDLLKVPHSEIKAKLDAEKAAKRERSAATKTSRKNTAKRSGDQRTS